jgi:glycosyltransferase involved in cell wall biosynthesis
MTIRCLHIVGQLGYGGITTWLKTLILQSARADLSIDICCNYRKSKGEFATEFRDLGCKVNHVPLSANPYSYAKKLGKLLKHGNYHIVHDHRGVLGGASFLAAKRARVPVRIMFHHTPDDELIKGFLRNLYVKLLTAWSYKYATNIWGCSNAVMVGQYGKNWRNKDVRFGVLYGSVSPKMAAPDARTRVRAELNISEKAKVVAFIGRVNWQKNVVVAIRSCLKVLSQQKDARVLWIGEGPLLPQVKEMVASAGLENRVNFLNFRKDISNILQSIDVLFLPSNFEGLPLLVLEALQAGVPFVGSNTPGLLEALPPAMHILCASPGDEDLHVKNIVKAFQLRHDNTLSRSFLEQFAPEAFYSRILAAYRLNLGMSSSAKEKG